MNLLELKDINKYYKSRENENIHVLKNINLYLKNELVSIVGESGSGKSTFAEELKNSLDDKSEIAYYGGVPLNESLVQFCFNEIIYRL
ncbi:ATP-binding cassette domain-containing protein [Clostridium sp. BL-8]|uniref:ATP-binding cassette domain-containing protein n=1 Tax=Clostridium sp. BL-8 TaxID=349938 RepID=UPI00098CBDA0|nr:ATP-binding cassette domain-containing protein [Clostridium sp. BL-8]OOM80334.1 macrolide export ATP-binding/permease protein MacB [Clostridium sp. BL-8]